jgi:hypothetical protein
MSIISVSSPFLRKFTHSETTVSTSVVELLASALPQEKRIALVVQNKSSTNSIEVILNSTGSVGLLVPPLGSLNLDNYNGPVRAIASGASLVHLAYSVV